MDAVAQGTPADHPDHPVDNIVSLHQVAKTYRTATGTTQALEPTTLDIRRGEFLSVVGPSGCGKSTLLTMISGLVPPSSGEVRIDGQLIDRPYHQCGIAFQASVLLEWRSVLDNVLLQFEMRGINPAPHRDKAVALLDSLGLEGSARLYPRELSGGMKQRVSIARALIHDPPLLLMDEPFSAVDALTRDQLSMDLQQVWMDRGRDLTVLFITHHIEEAVFLGDRVLVMTPRPGRIAEIVDIDLPRPRRLEDAGREKQAQYAADIRETFTRVGVYRSTGIQHGGKAS